MMKTREIVIDGKAYRPTPAQIIGEGGEATIYDVSQKFGASLALKLWKPPDHPDFQGSDDQARRNRAAAEFRIKHYAEKLAKLPRSLPGRLVLPIKFALDAQTGRPAGYLMELLQGAELLAKYAARDYREGRGISDEKVVSVFKDLHATFKTLHERSVVWGDVNFNNVMVSGSLARMIDTDSIQFGDYLCQAYTPRFTDPLICEADASRLIMKIPPNAESDWYSFALMLFECLLFVSPYGGVYSPKKRSLMLKHDERPLKRISVFHPDVIYPKRAKPLSWLPGRVSDYFQQLLKKDLRGEFPAELLELLAAKAGGAYVDSRGASGDAAIVETVRGKASLRRVFSTTGVILSAAVQEGKLLYLYHDGQGYRRENGKLVIGGPFDADCRFRLSRERTLVAKRGQMHLINGGQILATQACDTFRSGRPLVETNESHYFWLQDGKLCRDDDFSGLARTKVLGSCLEKQTLFWCGPEFGAGFYRAEGVQVGFTFNTLKGGLNDSVKLPSFKGKLVDAACHFTAKRAWMLVSVQDQGIIKNHCILLDEQGQVLARNEATEGDGSWLEVISGKTAASLKLKDRSVEVLFAATKKGLIALTENFGLIEVAAKYPDTRDFVEPEDRLLYVPKEGLYLLSRKEIQLLQLRG